MDRDLEVKKNKVKKWKLITSIIWVSLDTSILVLSVLLTGEREHHRILHRSRCFAKGSPSSRWGDIRTTRPRPQTPRTMPEVLFWSKHRMIVINNKYHEDVRNQIFSKNLFSYLLSFIQFENYHNSSGQFTESSRFDDLLSKSSHASKIWDELSNHLRALLWRRYCTLHWSAIVS